MPASILFIGSSVTYGFASNGVSFVEYLRDDYGYECYKEAVNGTTLTDIGSESYLSRERKISKELHFDLAVIQLSTNDTTKNLNIGDLDSTDTMTITGSIRAIVADVRSKYKCPLLFYSNPYYDDPRYEKLVDRMTELSSELDVFFLDFYNDEELNDVIDKDRNGYMADMIHPTAACYQKLLTPRFNDKIREILK